MKRIIVVYNQRSSKSLAAKEEILEQARGLTGFLVGKYEVSPTDVDDNAKKLSWILEDGDLVVAVGGDATASIGLNGCLLSEKDVVFSALSFGNFGDTARTLGGFRISEVIERFKKNQTKKFYPIEVVVDDEHFRYGAGYVTMGMMAESVNIFNQSKNRKKMRKKKRTEASSYRWLAKWYFKNRKKEFFDGKLTDYFAVNGRSVARIMKGKNYCFSKKFQVGKFKLSGFLGLCWFMMRAILCRIPGEVCDRFLAEFGQGRNVTIQMEGESKAFSCRKIELVKNRTIKVIAR